MPKKQKIQSVNNPVVEENSRKKSRRSPHGSHASSSDNAPRKALKLAPEVVSPKKKNTVVRPVPETASRYEPTGDNHRRRHKTGHDNEKTASTAILPSLMPPPGIPVEEIVRRAWKIYLGEITEEGLALMDDRSAEETAKKAFRVAEIFLLRAAAYRESNSAPF